MQIVGPRQEPVNTLDQWASIFDSSKKKRHWKRFRSAHSLAEFVMLRNGLDRIRRAVSGAIGADLNFCRAVIEHEVRFDSFGHGREHDLGVFGYTNSGQSVYVGVEAKVDEPFGPTVNEIYLDAKGRQLSGISTNAPERIEKLLQSNFQQIDRRTFGVRYQLLYSTVGTISAGADISVLYIAAFKTPLYDELIGADNYRDYLVFMNSVECRKLTTSSPQSDQREITVNGAKLCCIYEHIAWNED